MCCPEYPRKGTCSQPPGSRQPLTRVTVHGQRTALCHLDRTRVLLSRPSCLCGNGEHCKKVPGLDITKLVAVPPWLQKKPLWWCLYFIGSRNSFAQNFRIAWFRSPCLSVSKWWICKQNSGHLNDPISYQGPSSKIWASAVFAGLQRPLQSLFGGLVPKLGVWSTKFWGARNCLIPFICM